MARGNIGFEDPLQSFYAKVHTEPKAKDKLAKGYAITTVKIEGVEHEFSTITGVIEDVTDIVLNIKQWAGISPPRCARKRHYNGN